MPIYQNSTVNTTKLIIGNYQIFTATTSTCLSPGSVVSATWINLGAGMVNSFGHNITKYNVQAGNAPDPIEGVATETFTISADLLEFDASVMAAIQCGAITYAGGTAKAGGVGTLTPVAFKLVNTRTIAGSVFTTTVVVFRCTLDTGMQFTAKSDNDTDPINVIPITVTGKPQTTFSAGTQLYQIFNT